MALANVPLTGQNLNETRNPIRNNFNTIDTAFTQNHVSYGSTGEGKHKFLQMPEQDTANNFVTLVNEAGLYAGQGAISAVTELFFKREDLGVNESGIPFTEANIVEGTSTAMGWTYLPSGLVLKWGKANTTSSSSGAATASTTIDFDLATNGPRISAILFASAFLIVADSNQPTNVIRTREKNAKTIKYEVKSPTANPPAVQNFDFFAICKIA